MTLKAWTALANNELVAHDEVRHAVSLGELMWDDGEPATMPGDILGRPDHYCYTRADFQYFCRHTDMSGSGIALGELMSKAEMVMYRSLTPAMPSGFNASHNSNFGPPRIRVELSWSVQSGRGGLTLQRRIGGVGDYAPLTTLSEGETDYIDDFLENAGAAENDIIYYRIRYSVQPATHWATSSAPIIWPL